MRAQNKSRGLRLGLTTEVWWVGGVRGKYGRQELVTLSCALLGQREDLIMFSIIFLITQQCINTSSTLTVQTLQTELKPPLRALCFRR